MGMIRTAVAAVALVAFWAPAGALGPAQQAPQAPVFRAGVSTVSVWATVRDSEGRFVPNLTKDDFELRVGGKPSEISVFSADEQPITVCLLIDMSGSVMRRFLRMRDGAIHFVRALKPGDRARIGTFGSEISISPVLTGDTALLERILREELWPSGSTPLWGAMGAALESLKGEPGRRVLLTLTDGVAAGTLPGYSASVGDVADLVRDPGLVLYAVGMKDLLVVRPTLESALVDLAARSGGASFELTDDTDLEKTFSSIAEELRSQYLLGFVPEPGARGQQRISIRARGYSVRSRSSVGMERE